MATHRRGEYVRSVVLTAALREVVERGVEGVSVAGVARRAGVHETTVYRRWQTRENLLLEAMLAASAQAVPAPDTGSLRGDIAVLMAALCDYLRSPLGRGMVRALSISADERYDAHRRRFWAQRTESTLPIIERALDRGDLRPGTDGRLLLEALVAPLHARMLTTGEIPDDRTVARLVDLVLDGAAAR